MPAKHGYLLPTVINPDRICIQIEIPNEEYHLLAFWAQIEALGSALAWDNDADHKALPVSAVWREVYNDARENFYTGGCMDSECCDSLITGQSITNDLLAKIVAMMEGGITGVFTFNGNVIPPDLGGGDCAPDHFNHQTGEDEPEQLEQREKALCITVERYIKSIMLAALRDMGAPQFLIDFIESTLLSDVPLSLSKIRVSYPIDFSGLSVFFGIASAALSFDLLVCLMVDALAGNNNTFENFRNSVLDPTEGMDVLLAPLVYLVRSTNQSKDNYTQFNIALNNANNEDLEAFECPCIEPPPDDGCETPLEFTTNAGTVMMPLGDNQYQVTQSTPSPENGGRYIVVILTNDERCMHIELPSFAVAVHDILGCPDGEGDCFSNDLHGTGGFGSSINCRQLGFQVVDPFDQILTITCCVPTP